MNRVVHENLLRKFQSETLIHLNRYGIELQRFQIRLLI